MKKFPNWFDMEKRTQIIDSLMRNRFLTHVIYWSVIVGIYPFYGSMFGQAWHTALLLKLVYLPLQIVASYLLIYFQIPRFLYRGRYLYFILSIGVAMFIFAILHHLVEDYGIVYILGRFHPGHTVGQILAQPFIFYGFFFWTAYLIPVITAGVKMLKQAYEKQQQLTQLENEKKRAELDYLKARLQPRFLINTLDTLYRLTLEKSTHAPEVVIKLSEILDYLLYKCREDQVLLTDEMELLEKYLELERLRLGEDADVLFSHKIQDPTITIAPMLLLSLVEGLNGNPDTTANKQLNIDMKEDSQTFKCKIHSGKPSHSVFL